MTAYTYFGTIRRGVLQLQDALRKGEPDEPHRAWIRKQLAVELEGYNPPDWWHEAVESSDPDELERFRRSAREETDAAMAYMKANPLVRRGGTAIMPQSFWEAIHTPAGSKD